MTLQEIDEGILAARELLEELECARAALVQRDTPKRAWQDKYQIEPEFDS